MAGVQRNQCLKDELNTHFLSPHLLVFAFAGVPNSGAYCLTRQEESKSSDGQKDQFVPVGSS